MTTTQVPLQEITVDRAIQQRVDGVDEDWARTLADVLIEGGEFRDPPVVFKDKKGVFWLAAGFHRRRGAEIAGRNTILCEVRNGTRRDALKYSLGDNADQKPRSDPDKRQAVMAALADPEWSILSNRDIAILCSVSESLPRRIRNEMAGKPRADKVPKPRLDSRPEVMSDTPQDGRRESSSPASPPQSPPASRTHQGGVGADSGTPSIVAAPRDRCGRLLPPKLIPVFEEGQQILEAAKLARSALAKARNADKSKTVGGLLKRSSGIVPDLEDAADSLSRQAPYCVCPACAAEDDPECPTCGGCGWLSAGQYACLPELLKQECNHYRPGDSWEGDEVPVVVDPPPSPFNPPGPGKDALGKPIPRHLRDAFADEYLAQAAATLRRLASGLKSTSGWNPFLRPHWVDLSTMAESVEGSRPYAVCGTCAGAGCSDCMTKGFRPVWQREELKPKR